MRSETKLVKTASRGALAGGGERDRLLDDYQAPEADWLVSHNRPGLALASPDSRPRPRRDGQHSGVRKTQQLHRRSGRAGSTCSNVLAFKTLAGQHPGDQDCRRGLASCVLATRAREEGWGRFLCTELRFTPAAVALALVNMLTATIAALI